MNRRSFLEKVARAGAVAQLGGLLAVAAPLGKPAENPQDTRATHIPRWRGFNLQGRFSMPNHPYTGEAYEEFDFATMKEWGLNFARLPLAYWVWGNRDDWSVIRQAPLQEIDRTVERGRQYGIHININFHRIPGYCINGRELEPADIFTGKKEVLAQQVLWQRSSMDLVALTDRQFQVEWGRARL